jgi:hypothetical protein
MYHTADCLGNPHEGEFPDEGCVGEVACSQACVLDASCDALVIGTAADPEGWQAMYDCQVACLPTSYFDPTDTTYYGQGTTDPTGTSYGTETWGYTETEYSGGTAPRPECVAFASVYCGCLGNYASDTCEEDMAEECDWIYDIAPEFYDCVTAQQCQGDWLTACS